METISNICAVIVGVLSLALPVMLLMLVIRRIRKNPSPKLGKYTRICAWAWLLFVLVGTFTDPSTWCEHEYAIVEDVAPTCTEKGKLVKHCPLCDRETVEYPDTTPHSWGQDTVVAATCTMQGYTKRTCSVCLADDIAYTDTIAHSWKTDSVVTATCTSGGYTVEKCSECFGTRRINETSKTSHNMKEISHTEPTVGVDGEIVSKCDKCGYTDYETLPKLEPIIIRFDNLQLDFGKYSLTTVDNKYSDYYGQSVVRIPVTITNLSNSPHSLNYYYYTLFGTSGVESPDVRIYFDDDVSRGGDLLPGKSYVVYFHIIYDGDGIYTIVFDDWLLSKKQVEINVKK